MNQATQYKQKYIEWLINVIGTNLLSTALILVKIEFLSGHPIPYDSKGDYLMAMKDYKMRTTVL
jgi:hypothetical protein